MRYKNSDDNRYRVQFMRSTEELMDQLTVKEFISYLEENAEFEDYTVEYIDGKCVKCRAYDLTEENSKLHKEFLVTEDGRVFYWRSLISKIELVDAEEEKQEVQEVVVDFREAKEVAKEVAKELTEKDSNWKWRVQVLKSAIRVWWGYLQYCDTEDSHFTIKMSDREDECGTDTDFMVARNEHDEYMTGRIVGVDECWQDGDLNTCVAGLLRGIATIAHSRYQEVSKTVIKRLKGAKFGTDRIARVVTGYALYEEGKGYIAFSSDRDEFGILAPYIPCGGKRALQSILDAGGFCSFDGMEYVQELGA